VDAVSARRVIDRALRSNVHDLIASRPVHVIAVGKAAAAMAAAFLSVRHLQVRHALVIGTHLHPELPATV
jgi:glycerate-2-kinase